MPEIEYTDIKSIYNAFRIYAYIISPKDEDFREQVYLYRKAKWILQKPERIKKALKENGAYELAYFTETCLTNKFLKKFIAAKSALKSASIIVRLLRSMDAVHGQEVSQETLNLLSEPSISKAKWLFGVVFKEKTLKNKLKRKYALSERSLDGIFNTYRDVLHLCAAWDICKPLTKNDGLLAKEDEYNNMNMEERLTLFSEVSEDYLKFGAREFIQKRQLSPLQDMEKAVRFKAKFHYPKEKGGELITFGDKAKDTGLYSAERMAQYIKGYNQELEYNESPVFNDKTQNQKSA